MKLLVSTSAGQGDRPGDYHHTLDGELVTPLGPECDFPDRCGCGRGFAGLGSSRVTTTARVAELDGFGRAEVANAVEDWLERGGWRVALDDEEITDLVDEHLYAIARVCRSFPVGSILGRDGDVVFDRTPARA